MATCATEYRAAGERTRLVMNLSKLLAYDTKIDAGTDFITLQRCRPHRGHAVTRASPSQSVDTRHSLAM